MQLPNITPRIVLGTWGKRRPSTEDSVFVDLRACSIQRGPTRVMLSPRVMRVATILLCAGWRLTTKELINAVYFDHASGGPLDASGAVSQFIHRFRNALACLGIGLESGYGPVGYGVVFSEFGYGVVFSELGAEKVRAYRPHASANEGATHAAMA